MNDDNSLYREFRSEDLGIKRWESMEDPETRLEHALDFLLY